MYKKIIDAYIHDKTLPGGFFLSVLANDLFSACSRADSDNKQRLPEIVAYVLANVPQKACGSYQNVRKYLGREI